MLVCESWQRSSLYVFDTFKSVYYNMYFSINLHIERYDDDDDDDNNNNNNNNMYIISCVP
jgi:hypothetical protein